MVFEERIGSMLQKQNQDVQVTYNSSINDRYSFSLIPTLESDNLSSSQKSQQAVEKQPQTLTPFTSTPLSSSLFTLALSLFLMAATNFNTLSLML